MQVLAATASTSAKVMLKLFKSQNPSKAIASSRDAKAASRGDFEDGTKQRRISNIYIVNPRRDRRADLALSFTAQFFAN